MASKLAVNPPDSHNTFGFKRAEALAALFSMSCLFAVSLVLGVEAVHRGFIFWNVMQQEYAADDGSVVTGLVVDGKIMSLTAVVGVFVNICLAFILGEHHHHGPLGGGGGHDHSHEHEHGHGHKQDDEDGNEHHSQEHHNHSPDTSTYNHSHDHGREHGHGHKHEHEIRTESSPLLDNGRNDTTNNTTCETTQERSPPSKKERNVNLQAAYLHVLADLLQSVCVLLSGLLIWYNPHWQLIDPCITILFCFIVIKMTIGVITSSVSVLMNDVPPNVNWTEVYDGIVSEEGISCVQDLHIWSISHSSIALSAHVEYDEGYTVKDVLERIQDVCRKFGIYHTTVQLQSGVGEEVA